MRILYLLTFLLVGCSQPDIITFKLASWDLNAFSEPEIMTHEGQTLYLFEPEVLNEHSLQDVIVTLRNGKYVAQLTLTQKGQEALNTATQHHLGQPIAIFINGKLKTLITLDKPLSSIQLWFSAQFTGDELAALETLDKPDPIRR